MTGIGKVRVRLFARLADVAGTRTTEVELGEGLTAADAYRLLCRQHPGMEGLEGSLMYAVNAEYVPADHPLRDGDELALIPPVSGGSPHSVILSGRLPPTPTHATTPVLGNGPLTGAKNLAAGRERAGPTKSSLPIEMPIPGKSPLPAHPEVSKE